MIYGRLFGMDFFNAPFDDPNSFYKPFTFVTAFSVVFQMLPLVVGDVVGLFFVEWGYQLMITCIETFFISIIILVLTILEYLKLKKTLDKQASYYKVEPKLLENVMSGIDDTMMPLADKRITTSGGKGG